MFTSKHTKALIVLVLLFTISSTAFLDSASNSSSYLDITLTNTFYASSGTGASTDSGTVVNEETPSGEAPEYICQSVDELCVKVRESMISRITDFSIVYIGASLERVLSLETFDVFLSKVLSYNDAVNHSDYDYLRLSWMKAKLTVGSNDLLQTKYTFSFNYLTTLEEEVYIDQNVPIILQTLNVGTSSNYEKVQAVHDYIIKKVSYDNSLKQKSAYTALYSGKTICRGYSMLAYKLLDELSVPVRIITGTANKGAHAWNIVELDGKWYNLDVTWDDVTRSSSFFLKNTKDFVLHVRDAVFNADSFNQEYPIAPESYFAT